MYQHQQRLQPSDQQDVVPHTASMCRHSSLWLACNDRVMDQALSLTLRLKSALILRPSRLSMSKRCLIDDIGLELIEATVRDRGITQIVVCGHAGCSLDRMLAAEANLCNKSSYDKLLLGVRKREESNRQGQRHVLEHIRKLKQSPLLALAHSQRGLEIHGMFYFAESGAFTIYNCRDVSSCL